MYDDYHRKLDDEFDRLKGNLPNHQPKVGDRVLIAAGLIHRGPMWIRTEALVIRVGKNNTKIRFFHDILDETWVDNALIVEIINEH